MFAALPMLAQEHKWAGRTLNDLEWRIHEELAMVPFHGVFDTLRFDLQNKTVTLSGQVVLMMNYACVWRGPSTDIRACRSTRSIRRRPSASLSRTDRSSVLESS